MKRLSDGRRSREFREWCRKRANAGRGNKAFEAEILAGGKRAAEQLAEMGRASRATLINCFVNLNDL
jgi:hypothetical protein